MASSDGKDQKKGFAGLLSLASDIGEEQTAPAEPTSNTNSDQDANSDSSTRQQKAGFWELLSSVFLLLVVFPDEWLPVWPVRQVGHWVGRRLRKAFPDTDELEVEARDGDGWTPLHWAACRTREGGPGDWPFSDTSEVKLLLAFGADPNARDKVGVTPLHVAADEGEIRVLKLLLAAGADVMVREDEDGRTPLHLEQSGFYFLGEGSTTRATYTGAFRKINFRSGSTSQSTKQRPAAVRALLALSAQLSWAEHPKLAATWTDSTFTPVRTWAWRNFSAPS